MAKNEDTKIHIITPRAVVSYPRLLKPDVGTKQNPQKPNFNVKGTFSPGGKFVVGKKLMDHDEVVALLEAARDEEFDKQLADAKSKKNGKLIKLLHKAPVFAAVVDGEGNETGELSVRAKTAAEYKDKDTGQIVKKDPPTMFDAKGKKIEKLPPVGGGSEMKIGAQCKPYFVAATGAVGITFYLEATQLLKLVKYTGGKSAEAMGFGAEEGYTEDDVPGFGADDSNGDTDSKSTDSESSDEDF